MLKYIFVVGKSTQKIVFLLTPAGIGDFKSVIRISPSYKNKTNKKQSSWSYSKPFYHRKKINLYVWPPLYRGTFNRVFNPATETACIKTQETKLPGTRQLNDANRKKKWIFYRLGWGFCLFVCFFTLYRLTGLLEFSGCRSGVSVHTT